jgi:hypothetical protein
METSIIWQTLGKWQQQHGFVRKHVPDAIMPEDEARTLLLGQEIPEIIRRCLDMDDEWRVMGLRDAESGNVALIVGLPQADGYPP